MASSGKPSKDPFLEQKYVSFLRERISLYKKLSVNSLTGHLSALSPYVRNHFGPSRNSLRQFLIEHSEVFFVDKHDNVRLVIKDAPSSEVSSVSKDSSEKPENVDASPNHNEPSSASSEQSKEFPKELTKVLGKVIRIFPEYGFIKVSNPVSCSVYFNVSSFERSENEGNDGAVDISIGDKVYLNATKGPDNVEAEYKATKVWFADLQVKSANSSKSSSVRNEMQSHIVKSRRSSDSSSSKTSVQNEICGTGVIENLFINYGFIKQGRSIKDNIFFHLDKFKITGPKITDLASVLKPGDTVKFCAVQTKKKDSLVNWQATKVWTAGLNSDDFDNSEIYYSSPEVLSPSGSVESLPLTSTSAETGRQLNGCNSEIVVPFVQVESLPLTRTMVQNGRKLNGHNSDNFVSSGSVESLPPTNTIPETGKKLNGQESDNFVGLDSSISKISPNSLSVGSSNNTIIHKSGSIWPCSNKIASINFDGNQKALVLADVCYQHDSHINSLLWEVDDGQEVNFEAVHDLSWAPEYPWKATLVWVGSKPNVSVFSIPYLKEVYFLAAGETVDFVEKLVLPENINDGIGHRSMDSLEENQTHLHDVSNGEPACVDFLTNVTSNMTGIFESSVFSKMSEAEVAEIYSTKAASQLPGFGCLKSLGSTVQPTEQVKHDNAHGISSVGQIRANGIGPPAKGFSASHKKFSYSWADVSEKEVVADTANHNSPQLDSNNNTRMQDTSIHKVPRGLDSQADPTAEASISLLKQQVQELSLMVKEFLKSIPVPKSVDDKSTQTDLLVSVDKEYVPRLSTVNQDVQTISTGPVSYVQLFTS